MHVGLRLIAILIACGATMRVAEQSLPAAEPLSLEPPSLEPLPLVPLPGSTDARFASAAQPFAEQQPPAAPPIFRLPETEVVAEPPDAFAVPRVAQAPTLQQRIDAIGRAQSLLGEMGSASEGMVGQAQLQYRPLLRPGEVFETIPGVIVTQHSGSGKANQWFLRGFNLDHGTDFSIKVDNVPINLPTHAHGQGYLDVNFLIPELIYSMEYKKGPYYAEQGDFSSAGGAEVRIMDRLPQNIAKAGIGSFGYYRTLFAGSSDAGAGHALYAFEYQHYDGPWVVPERFGKYNGLYKYTLGDEDFGASISTQNYYSQWTSTDQIPLRAVRSGQLSLFGTLNPTDGGVTYRSINNAQLWHRWSDTSITKVNAYAQYYQLDLYNDFTFYLDDPVNGDQFAQRDRRAIYGTMLSHQWERDVLGARTSTTIGAQLRDDDIPRVALDKTANREVLSTTRDDKVNQASLGLYASRTRWWFEDVRTIVGTRGDFYNFDVNSRTIAENSGFVAAGVWSPKASIVFGPWDKSEYFVNWGRGFHSNDARGTTTRIDPASLTAVDPVTPLVRSQGYEVGFRSSKITNLNTSLAVWYLDLGSELLFVGDAGTTEPSRASRRYGVEWANYYTINPWLRYDFDIADTHSRFVGDDPSAAGNYIPGAIGLTLNTGPTFTAQNGLFTSLRLRHFGPRPLTEDNGVRSNSTSLVDLRVGLQKKRFQCGIDVFNLLATTNHDIDYYYASRLPGEPAGGVNDIHFHPVEKTGVRGWVNLAW
ncbi:MAG: TonB-dependent receptor plug domain-containing protein [Planctomycetia bacterium]|nr:TonB-dependent receptor plug domain-containing protein [Planctomycetia bacterium]